MSHLRLPGRADSVTVARHAVAADLGRAGVAGEALFAAKLVVSELVGNAVRHASPTSITLTWSVADGAVRIEVCDDEPGLPMPGHAEHTDEGGRGLFLVASVSQRWGAEASPDAGGKMVWAEIGLAG